jgi:Domain of unknown function (DUF6378)
MNPKLKDTPIDVAESILLDAGTAIRDRLQEHGHTERSFKMIGELWSNYITHAYTSRDELHLQAHDVAQMMALVKIARATYGYSLDNFVDGAGYTALAAMLTPVPDIPVKEPTIVSNGAVMDIPSFIEGKR